MASIKAPKGDLDSIFKLEFYKKQKNWKFCSQERKAKESKRPTESINANLNQTYSVAPAPASPKKDPSEPEIPEAEDRDILNEAFVKTETGTGSESDEHVCQDLLKKDLDGGTDNPSSHLDPPFSPYSPRWSIQRWADQEHLWNPEPSPTKPIEPMSDPFYPEHNPNYPHRLDTDLQLCHQDTNVFFVNNFNKIQQGIYSNQNPYNIDAYSHNELYYTNRRYNPEFTSEIYYKSNMCHYGDDLNVGSVEKMCEGDVGDWGAGEAAGSAMEWAEAAAGEARARGEDATDGAWRPHLGSVSECESLTSVSSGEFIGGAALAAHSTQVDLLLAPEHSRLSGAALAAAVEGHSAALIELLQETQRRQQIPQKKIPLPSLHSFAAAAPGAGARRGAQLHAPAPAGRGRPVRARGAVRRGRGRLQVGIRRGRPFWLSN